MTVIDCPSPGGPDHLQPATRPLPTPGAHEVLIAVAAAGLNRADLMQRRGKYPPPPGASEILGMEVAGTVAAVGAAVTRWKAGDRVCALLGGGGYATYAVAHESHCLPVPDGVAMVAAACLVEAIVTVYANLFEAGGLRPGDTVLIHGGSSGIGTAAIQIGKLAGASVLTTVGSDEKMETCYALGADFVVKYRDEDFVEAVLRATNRRGARIVLDMVGGDYVNRNLQTLSFGGRHVSIATQQHARAGIDLRLVMGKQLRLTGSTLRSRDTAEKGRLIAAVADKIWPWVADGRLKPVIFQTFPLKNAAEAHKVMESGAHIGQIALEVSEQEL